MTVEELLCLACKDIHKYEARLVLATLLDKNPLELTMHLDLIVDVKIKDKFLECVQNIKNGIPLQYALNSTNFMGYDFYVDKRVLIPRFETEELVYNTNLYLKKYFSNPKILDIGSGSGCCGLVLKKIDENRDVTLLDISSDAMDVALINSKKLNVEVNYLVSNLFSKVNSKYDVIISNPPYISFLDKEVTDLVKNNEPSIALYAENNGLFFYENILKSCESYLNDKYLIAFEIGYKQKDEVIKLINKYLKDVLIITKKDMSFNDRMIFIFKNIDIYE